MQYFSGARHLLKWVLPVLVLLLFSMPSSAEEWRIYSSDNFRIYSDTRQNRAIEMLESLEQFRHIVFDFLAIQEEPPRAPFNVLYFEKRSDYVKYRRADDEIYSFSYGPDGPYLIYGAGLKRHRTQVLFHSYLRYVLLEHIDLGLPDWLRSGLMQLLGHAHLRRDQLRLGRGQRFYLCPSIVNEVRMVNVLESEFETEPERRLWRGVFEFSSWVLVRKLFMDYLENEDDSSARMRNFLEQLRVGVAAKEAFVGAFGRDPEEMTLDRIANCNGIRIKPLRMPELELEIKQRLLEGADPYLVRARFARFSGKAKLAANYLKEAQALDPDNTHAIVAQVLQLIMDGRHHHARGLIASTTVEADSAYLHLDAGEVYLRLMAERGTSEDMHLTELRLAEAHALAAEALDPLLPSAKLNLARIYWAAGEKQKALDAAIEAVGLVQGSADANFLVGSYMAELGQEEYARFFLGNVIDLSVDNEQRKEALKLVRQFVSSPVIDERIPPLEPEGSPTQAP